MTLPEGGDGDGERDAKRSTQEGFDDVWGALVDSASADAERSGVTKAWTEEARGERKREAPSSAASSSALLLGPDPGKLRASAENEMERLMRSPPAREKDGETAEPVKVEPVKVEPVKVEPVKVEPVKVEPVKVEPVEVEPVEVEPAKGEAGRIGLLIAGVAAIAVLGYFLFGRADDPQPVESEPPAVPSTQANAGAEAKPTAPREGALASARDPARREAIDDPEPAEQPTKADPPETDANADANADVDDEEDAEADAAKPDDAPAPTKAGAELRRDGDPREVPAGTPPANAAAFRKLPVAPADRPPLGGVGLDGVHVDRLAVGSAVERSRCRGDRGEFSISGHELVNVCLRVVHARQKEDLIVLWQKDGGTVRRGKFVVPAVHAYRTRAYLVLRKEYVGKWTVRILDQKGTELASHPFVVVE